MAVKLEEKSHKAEEAEVEHCVSNLIHAFYNGLNIFKKLRERRRKRKGRKENQPADAAASEEKQLSKSLKRGPQELAETYDACYKQTGQSFAKGDATAHASLAETLVKLNTGLVAIIASFLNHDQKGGKALNINYQSLTNLSDASRKEALQSMTQLYQRLSQSQLQIQHIGHQSCTKCGSNKHADCSARSSSTSTSTSSKEKKKQTSSRQRVTGPTITRMPTKSSRQPQLVVVRPRPSSSSRKSNSRSPSSSKSPSPSSSAYTSPLASPLPLYIAEEPFEIDTNGIIAGVLGAPMPPLAGHGRRRKDSFTQHDPRQTTWPDDKQTSSAYPYMAQEHLHLPGPKLPSFTHAPHRQTAPQQKTSSPSARSEKYSAAPPVSLPVRRRIDKMTPSAYTFASDSTKLGEIPQRSWTTPWDYEEADRLNHEARTAVPIVVIDEKVGRKKGIFKWMRN
ncbi:hypothetical protein HBI25_099180 [Parastagonospora nodorum]|nr:hypothetical protein HBI95_217060 [Parastagonospora nodorum]KAH4193597.1 hypothetical protein HBH42_102570 [Parastagonospora nodorum]KAH5279861.1 hypothetical protein HBI70_080280 [Parastagonospora nodorum]KAH5561596.1 hypothetical protein HBI25_099180 [Parastagonospora nodorum]